MSTQDTSSPARTLPRLKWIHAIRLGIASALKKIRESEPLEPIVTKLLERPLQGFWLLCGIIACAALSTRVNDIALVLNVQLPFHLVFVILLLNAFINIAVLPLSSSFRSLLSLHCMVLVLTMSFLLLTITNSPFLTILLALTFGVIGFERSKREQHESDSSIWNDIRLVFTIICLFIAVGHHVFEYSDWLYELRFLHISVLGSKDLLSYFFVGLVIFISFIQSLAFVIGHFADFAEDRVALPPGTRRIEIFRRYCGKRAEKLAASSTRYNSNVFARLSASAKKVGLVLIAMIFKAAQIPLVMALVIVGTLGYAFSMLAPRNIRATMCGLVPFLFIAVIVALALHTGSVFSHYPQTYSSISSNENDVAWWLIFGLAAAAIFASLNFRSFHLPKVTKVEVHHQRLEQIIVCIFIWPIFFTAAIFFTQWYSHKSIDLLSGKWLLYQFLLITVLWIINDCISGKPESSPPVLNLDQTPTAVSAALILTLVGVVLVSVASWAHPGILAMAITTIILLGALLAIVEPKKTRWKASIFLTAAVGGITSIATAAIIFLPLPIGQYSNWFEMRVQQELLGGAGRAGRERVERAPFIEQLAVVRSQLGSIWSDRLSDKNQQTKIKSALLALKASVDADNEHTIGLAATWRPNPSGVRQVLYPNTNESRDLDGEDQYSLFDRLVIALKVTSGHDSVHGDYIGLSALVERTFSTDKGTLEETANKIKDEDRRILQVPNSNRWKQLALSLGLHLKNENTVTKNVIVFFNEENDLDKPLGFIELTSVRWLVNNQLDAKKEPLFTTYFSY